ncbi:Tad domain-containing protein [Stieleria neptunia]|nr:Tad domain-containing protein [Stieleria neptunia]
MVLLAMLLFGLFAMAALVIDLGFARLAQRQMQSAADSAALEGLRFRDQLPPNASSTDFEVERRTHVQQWVTNAFDDDLGATSDDHTYGGGPIVDFVGGAGDASLNASQTMSTPPTPFYRPTLSTNLSGTSPNSDSGDMVSGYFDRTLDNPNFDSDIPPSENEYVDDDTGQYVRRNFIAGDMAQRSTHNAFLVRLRRTGETLSSELGSSGPPIPYLFGRGSLMDRGLTGDGMRVRATSIASVRPIVCVGSEDPARNIIGSIGMSVSAADFEAGDLSNPLEFHGRCIGDPVTSTTVTNFGSLPRSGYLGIHQIYDVPRVIAFTRVEVQASNTIQASTFLAHQNASASYCFGIAARDSNGDLLSLDDQPSIADKRVFVEDHLSFVDASRSDSFMAPVLVRN